MANPNLVLAPIGGAPYTGSFSFTVDIATGGGTAPVVELVAPTDGATLTAGEGFLFRAAASASVGRTIASAEVIWNGGALSPGMTKNEDSGYWERIVTPNPGLSGSRTVAVRVTDSAGEVTTSATRDITVALPGTGDLIDDYFAIVDVQRVVQGLAVVTSARKQMVRDWWDGMASINGNDRQSRTLDLILLGADFNVGAGTTVYSLRGRVGTMLGTGWTWAKTGITSAGGDAVIEFDHPILSDAVSATTHAVLMSSTLASAPSASKWAWAQWPTALPGAVMAGASSAGLLRTYGRGTSAEDDAARTGSSATTKTGWAAGRQGTDTISTRVFSATGNGQTIESTLTGVGAQPVPGTKFYLFGRDSRNAANGWNGEIQFALPVDFWTSADLITIYDLCRTTWGRATEINIAATATAP